MASDLNDLLLFAELGRRMSVTGTANALSLPKSTVSRRLAAMESRLGVQLVHRHTRKLQLTPIGQTYWERCLAIREAVEDSDALLDDMQRLPSGLLRLSLPVEFAIYFMASPIAEFLRANPGIQIDIDLNARIVDLVAEQFDMAIRLGQPPEANYVVREIGRLPRFLYASPDYLEDHGRPQTPEDLRDHEFLVYAQMARPEVELIRGRDRRKVEVSGRIRVNNASIARRFALEGLGIAMLADVLAREDYAWGTLERVLPDYALEPLPVLALLPSRAHLPHKTRAFLDFLVTRLSS